jgi:hypothetical protein
MSEQTKTRRTHEQSVAFKKYPRMRWISGNGEWLALSKCLEKWSYTLHSDQWDALSAMNKPCGPECRGTGNHAYWRLLETKIVSSTARQKPIEAICDFHHGPDIRVKG